MGLNLVALAELCTSALRAAAAGTAAATRAAPVAPLLPRTTVALAALVEGFDVFGLEILIRISVVVPADEHVIAASWKPQTQEPHFTSMVPSE